jgi:hypothetical protein
LPGKALALQFLFSGTRTGYFNEVPTILTRVAIPLLLLPLLALAVPLMFAWAWVQEAISERAPPDHPSMES